MCAPWNTRRSKNKAAQVGAFGSGRFLNNLRCRPVKRPGVWIEDGRSMENVALAALPPILPSGACLCRRAGSLSWLCLVSWSPRSGPGLSSWTKSLLTDGRVVLLLALSRHSGPGSHWKNFTALSMIAGRPVWPPFLWLPCANGKSHLRRVRAPDCTSDAYRQGHGCGFGARE